MIAVETAIRFTGAWLTIGLALFIAGESLNALRRAASASTVHGVTSRRFASLLFLIPLLAALALAYIAVLEVFRVVPW